MMATDKEQVEREIREVLATENRAIFLSDRLFSPEGLFSRLASSAEERQVLVRSPLFKEAQKRFRDLQYQEAAAFSKALPQSPDGCVVKIEKATGADR